MGKLSERLNKRQPLERQQQPLEVQDHLQDILSNEHRTKLGVIEDIKVEPIPVGVGTEEIGGVPMDWHDLEKFVVSISPTKFVTLLKLQKQMIKDYGLRFTGQRKAISGKIILLILMAVGLAVIGILVMMFMPEIMAMFGGG